MVLFPLEGIPLEVSHCNNSNSVRELAEGIVILSAQYSSVDVRDLTCVKNALCTPLYQSSQKPRSDPDILVNENISKKDLAVRCLDMDICV